MHLTALVDDPQHVCCRYRVTAFQSMLESGGHRVEVRPWPRHWWGWLGLARAAAAADAVLIQRRLLAGWQLRLLRRTRCLLFDFDDAVFLRDSYSARGFHSGRRMRRFAAVVQACDAVVAGNDYLAEAAWRLAPTSRVHVIPTCVDPNRYLPADPGSGDRGVQLVWLGSASTLQGLERRRPLLEELGRHFPGLTLKLICDRFLDLTHLPVVPCRWTEATEAAELATADVGISWVPDDPWSRGKCGLKVLQYMAAGLPVVANPVGVQERLIEPGVTGFLAATPAEWIEAVGRLAHDPDLRRRMGRAARQRVAADFSVAAGGRLWLDLLARLGHRREVA